MTLYVRHSDVKSLRECFSRIFKTFFHANFDKSGLDDIYYKSYIEVIEKKCNEDEQEGRIAIISYESYSNMAPGEYICFDIFCNEDYEEEFYKEYNKLVEKYKNNHECHECCKPKEENKEESNNDDTASKKCGNFFLKEAEKYLNMALSSYKQKKEDTFGKKYLIYQINIILDDLNKKFKL